MDVIEKLYTILVAHAHTDHTGALELIAGQFPGVPVEKARLGFEAFSLSSMDYTPTQIDDIGWTRYNIIRAV